MYHALRRHTRAGVCEEVKEDVVCAQLEQIVPCRLEQLLPLVHRCDMDCLHRLQSPWDLAKGKASLALKICRYYRLP